MISFKSLRLPLLALLAVAGMSSSAQAVAPTAPSNCSAIAVSAVGSNVTIDINWDDNSTNETQWKIQYSIGDGAFNDLAPIGSLTTAGTGPTGTGITAPVGNDYHFKVIAINGAESSAPSNVANVGAYALNAPTNLTATLIDPFNVTLSLNENSYTEAGFAVERKTGSGAWEYLGSLPTNALSVGPISLIAPLDTFKFRVRAYTGSAPSTPGSPAGATVTAYSNEASVTTGAYTLGASADTCQHLINLSWPNIQNESGYEIWYKIDGASSFTYLHTTAENVTTYPYAIPDRLSSMTYSFKVKPYQGSTYMGGESSVADVILDASPTMTSRPGISAPQGTSFSHTFTHVRGGTMNFQTLTGVPSTLTFNNTNGILSGVFPAPGTYTLNYSLAFTSGCSLTQIFTIIVPTGTPLVATPIPAWNGTVGTTRDTLLSDSFTDPNAASAVRVSTTLGTMDFILYNAETPQTVTNFMHYVNSGKYSDVIFHRTASLESGTPFIIQGGGFNGTGTASDFAKVPVNPDVSGVPNEPGINNVRGTIAMAKLGGNPNSATDQFFVNLNDNRSILDAQNGGFTVFGRVAGNGMEVADDIHALPRGNYTSPPANLTIDGVSAGETFAECPMNAATAPATMDQTKLVKMNSVTPIPTLSYTITGNTNPSVATASIVSGQLHLVGLTGGQTTITVTATDLDYLTTSQTVSVNLTDTYSSWASRNSFTGGQNGATQNPDGDALTNLLEYALFGNPSLASQAPVPTSGKTGVSPAPQFMTLTFAVRKLTTGLIYIVEANNQLSGSWSEVWNSASDPTFGSAQVLGKVDQADRTMVTIKDNSALSAQAQRFMRLRVLQY